MFKNISGELSQLLNNINGYLETGKIIKLSLFKIISEIWLYFLLIGVIIGETQLVINLFDLNTDCKKSDAVLKDFIN